MMKGSDIMASKFYDDADFEERQERKNRDMQRRTNRKGKETQRYGNDKDDDKDDERA